MRNQEWRDKIKFSELAHTVDPDTLNFLKANPAYKWCNKCQRALLQENFSKNKAANDGLNNYCKKCKQIQRNEWYWKDPSKLKYINILWKYGLTKKQLEELILKQNNKCAICKISFETHVMEIDHDHNKSLKSYRGLLCFQCNKGLGYFNDDIRYLARAIQYLQEHSI